MRALKTPPAVTPEYITSGASGYIYETPDPLDMGTVASGDNSNHKNIDLKFPPSPNFDPIDDENGYFEPVAYMENMPALNGVKMVQKEVAAWTAEDTGDLAGDDMYTVEVDTDATNKLDTADFDTAEGRTKILQVQLQRTAVALANAYNTEKKDRSNPAIIWEWFRKVTQDLDAVFPNPNSDHIWNFSSADLYMRKKHNPGSGEIEQRWLLGWIADPDFEVNVSHETVEFTKGKPAATAVKFISKCISSITAQLATFDPSILAEALHLPVQKKGGRLIIEETNKQRPIEINELYLEWRLNGGYKVTYRLPRAQMFITGGYSPGGEDIVKIPIEINPLVKPTTGSVYKLELTEGPVEKAVIPISFNLSV